ncbi:hypothetical protein D3C85_1094280 [compost metagenome]
MVPSKLSVPLLVRAATCWLRPAVSSVAPGAMVCAELALKVSTAPARKVPCATVVAPL